MRTKVAILFRALFSGARFYLLQSAIDVSPRTSLITTTIIANLHKFKFLQKNLQKTPIYQNKLKMSCSKYAKQPCLQFENYGFHSCACGCVDGISVHT